MFKLYLTLLTITPAITAQVNLDNFNQAVQELDEQIDDIHVYKHITITPIYIPSTITTPTSNSTNTTTTQPIITPPRIKSVVNTTYHYETGTKVAEESLKSYRKAYRWLRFRLLLRNSKHGIITGVLAHLVPALIRRTTGYQTSKLTHLAIATAGIGIGCYRQTNLPPTPYYSWPELIKQDNLFTVTSPQTKTTIITQVITASIAYTIESCFFKKLNYDDGVF